MIASNHIDEEDDSMKDEDFHLHDDTENALDALNKIKDFIEKLDADAERVQQEIANAIKDYNNESDDDSDVSGLDLYGITTSFLAAIQDKENEGKGNPALQLNTGGFQEAILSPLTPALLTKTPSHRRTPLASREKGDNVARTTRSRFSFTFEPSPTLVTTPATTFRYHRISRQNGDRRETPPNHPQIQQDHQLSPSSIKVESPVKANDPYEWAYAVWRAHGLMGRTGETPHRKLEIDVTDSTPMSSFHVADTLEWDLSPLAEFLLDKRKSSVTKGADRAKEFARESTGNFQNVLSTWRKGHMEDTPSRTHAPDFARLRKPDEFQELLRKWREARQEQAASGQKRAMTYASEAKTNLQGILKIWHDSQTAEFEHWAQAHAKSPDEFHALLSKWRQARVDRRPGVAVNERNESDSNIDEVMEHWRESHETEFEDWAREQSHTSDEFQELLRHWREALPDYESSTREEQDAMLHEAMSISVHVSKEVDSTQDLESSTSRKSKQFWQELVEPDVLESRKERASSPVEYHEQVKPSKEESCDKITRTYEISDLAIEKFDHLLSRWRLAEATSFHEWARQQTSCQSEFQSLLRKWRDGNPYFEHGKEILTTSAACETFENALAMWRQSETYDFKEWAQMNSASSDAFDILVKQWKAVGEETSGEKEDKRIVNRDFDMLLLQWRAAEGPKFHKWARQNTCSKEDFHVLLKKWRDFSAGMAPDQQALSGWALSGGSNASIGQIRALLKESEADSVEEWVQLHASSKRAFQHLTKESRHKHEEQNFNLEFDGAASRCRSCAVFDSGFHTRASTRCPFQAHFVTDRQCGHYSSSEGLRALDLAHLQGSDRNSQNVLNVLFEESKHIRFAKFADGHKQSSKVPIDALRLEALDLAVIPTEIQTNSIDGQDEDVVRRQSSAMQKVLRRWREDGPDWTRANSDRFPNVETQLDTPETRNTPESLPLSTHSLRIRVVEETESERLESGYQTPMMSEENKQHIGSVAGTWATPNPVVHTGKQRAEEFARDSSGNFMELVSNWREPQSVPNCGDSEGKKRAQECSRNSTGKFSHLITTWKSRPSHLEGCQKEFGIDECTPLQHASRICKSNTRNRKEYQQIDDCDQTALQLPHQGQNTSSENEVESINNLKSRPTTCDQHSAVATLSHPEKGLNLVGDVLEPFDTTFGEGIPQCNPPNKMSKNVAATNIEDQAGGDCDQNASDPPPREEVMDPDNDDELLSYWKSKVNRYDDALEGRWTYGGSPRISERSVAWEKDVVTDIKLYSDDVSSDEDHHPYTPSETRERIAAKYFEGLISNRTDASVTMRTAELLVIDVGLNTSPTSHDLEKIVCGDEVASIDAAATPSTGKKDAAQYELDARSNFEALKTNWSLYETQNNKGWLTEGGPNKSVGKLRAAELAHDANVDFNNLRTAWCTDFCGQDVPHDNLSESAGKRRAQEFASNASVAIRDLMEKWSDKHYSSLEFESPCAQHQSISIPRMTPIKDFIAALSAGHAPTLGSVSSKEDLEETESLFDDVEVASNVIPEGEDPIVAPNGHLRSCACASSNFSGTDKLVEFFLPQLGMACTCGKEAEIFPDPEVNDPTSIDMILRPWQCEFLKSFGIHRGDQLVKAYHRSAGILAKAMKKWRKKHNMVRARTVSCGLALHIWSKVCKIYVRSIRRQIASGVDVIRPPTAMTVLSQLLSQGDRRVSVPHSGRKPNLPDLIEVDSEVEI